MSIWDKISDGINTVVQGAGDVLTNGPDGPAKRQELEGLKGQRSGLANQFQTLDGEVKAWQDPLNDCGKYTSSLLQQSSDYVHGVAVLYQQAVQSDGVRVSSFQALANEAVTKPLIDIPVPGNFGGVPSVLVPGVEVFKMVTGVVNMFYDSATLDDQISKMHGDIAKIGNALRDENDALRRMQELSNWLLAVANRVVQLYRATIGIGDLPWFAARSPAELTSTCQHMQQTIARLTSVNGNAFRVMRLLTNLIHKSLIGTDGPSPSQVDWIVNALYQDGQIQSAFGSPDNLRRFVESYFNIQLIKSSGFLVLPPVPPDLANLLNETPPEKQEYSDVNAPRYDPPNVSLSDFPS